MDNVVARMLGCATEDAYRRARGDRAVLVRQLRDTERTLRGLSRRIDGHLYRSLVWCLGTLRTQVAEASEASSVLRPLIYGRS